jgi:hypothetical protein
MRLLSKKVNLLINKVRNTPGRIRTCDLRIRNPLLYPAELRALRLKVNEFTSFGHVLSIVFWWYKKSLTGTGQVNRQD